MVSAPVKVLVAFSVVVLEPSWVMAILPLPLKSEMTPLNATVLVPEMLMARVAMAVSAAEIVPLKTSGPAEPALPLMFRMPFAPLVLPSMMGKLMVWVLAVPSF